MRWRWKRLRCKLGLRRSFVWWCCLMNDAGWWIWQTATSLSHSHKQATSARFETEIRNWYFIKREAVFQISRFSSFPQINLITLLTYITIVFTTLRARSVFASWCRNHLECNNMLVFLIHDLSPQKSYPKNISMLLHLKASWGRLATPPSALKVSKQSCLRILP